MGITVKKKKLTVKTVRAQAHDDEAGAVTADPSQTAETPEMAAAPVAAPVAAVAAPTPTAKPASYVLAGTLAIIAFLFFTTVIILQVVEWNYHSEAFPHPVELVPTAGAGAVPPPIAP
jgi:hypothetical protein